VVERVDARNVREEPRKGKCVCSVQMNQVKITLSYDIRERETVVVNFPVDVRRPGALLINISQKPEVFESPVEYK